MEPGWIPHEIRDRRRGVTYVVLAGRALTRDEVTEAIRAYNARTGRRPSAGSTITIVSTLGDIEGT